MENPDASAAVVAPVAHAGAKRAAKPRPVKLKEFTTEERAEESRKRQDRRKNKKAREKDELLMAEAVKDAARMHAIQAEAATALLAKQAVVHAILMLKQEAIGLCPAAGSVGGGSSSTSSVTQPPSGRPPLHRPMSTQGEDGTPLRQSTGAPSRLADARSTSPDVTYTPVALVPNLNRTPASGDLPPLAGKRGRAVPSESMPAPIRL